MATYRLRTSASVYMYICVSRSPGNWGKLRVQNGVLCSFADAVFKLLVHKQAEIWTSLLHSFIKQG